MRRLAFSVALPVLLAACSRKPDPPSASPAASTRPGLTPALTRPLVLGYISSLLDPTHPSNEPGALSPADLDKADLFSRKYGFRDFADFSETRAHIALAKVALMKRKLEKTSAANIDLMIKVASDTLLNPDATADQKKAAGESLTSAMELKRAMAAPSASSVIAPEDVALVAEFLDQIEAAELAASPRK